MTPRLLSTPARRAMVCDAHFDSDKKAKHFLAEILENASSHGFQWCLSIRPRRWPSALNVNCTVVSLAHTVLRAELAGVSSGQSHRGDSRTDRCG
jgi:hypothetical protein